jgi:hypothetical protein
MVSLNKAAGNIFNLKKDDFIIGDEHANILLSNIIIAKSQIDTRFTITPSMIKHNLLYGDIMASQNNDNIVDLNAKINKIFQKLNLRGGGDVGLERKETFNCLLDYNFRQSVKNDELCFATFFLL